MASPQAAQGVGLSTPGPRHTPSHKASPAGFPLLSLTKNAAYNYLAGLLFVHSATLMLAKNLKIPEWIGGITRFGLNK